MKVILDPNGTPSELPQNARVRFEFSDRNYIEVYERGGALVVRSQGWPGGLSIEPRVTNEIEVRIPLN